MCRTALLGACDETITCGCMDLEVTAGRGVERSWRDTSFSIMPGSTYASAKLPTHY